MRNSPHELLPAPAPAVLLSRTTILILSSFLVAYASQWIGDDRMQWLVFSGGTAGVLAFVVTECRATFLKHLVSMRSSRIAGAKLARYVGRYHTMVAISARDAVHRNVAEAPGIETTSTRRVANTQQP